MIKRVAMLLAAALVWPALASADTVTLRPGHPEHYVVKKGDTLWGIAGRFLNEPWRWKDIWQANPQIKNPDLIYPGDEIVVTSAGGKTALTLRRNAHPTVKLSPTVHVTDIGRAIPTIPIDKIQQFLRRPRVVTEQEMENAPYVVSVGREALIASPGSKFFARGLSDPTATSYIIYRKGQAYVDPGSGGKVLGYEAVHVGDATLEKAGDPATLFLTRADREVLVGDRLFPVHEEEIDRNFMPRAPAKPVNGQIISVVDGVNEIGQYQVVVLNVGRDDGIQRGDVMAVYQRGAEVVDPLAVPPKRDEGDGKAHIVLDPAKQGGLEGFARAATDVVISIQQKIRDATRFLGPAQSWQTVKLPDERAGTVMVFRPFDRVSYALVMEAKRPMHLLDAVKNP